MRPLRVNEQRALVAGLCPGLVDGVKRIDDAIGRFVDEREDVGVMSAENAEVEGGYVVHVEETPLVQE